MKIAILEICSSTHYTIINALMKTYSTDPNNTIVVYTLADIAKTIRAGGIPNKTSLVVFDENNGATVFFKDIENTHFDRLHICTIGNFYPEFARFRPKVKDLYFHLHDIDIWFEAGFKNKFKNWLFDLKNDPHKVRATARFLKDVLVRQPVKDKILKYLLKRKPYFIVMSYVLKANLSRFIDEKDIIVFPTLIYEGHENHSQHQQSDKIRICIPGIVTDTRRDYTGLFKMLDNILPHIKNKLIFDLLGFVDKKELHLLDTIKSLQNKGLEIHYSLDFIDAVTFDESLAKADILLNNQTIVVSHTGQYGVTKDSGLLFNIVRGAKPAIFPTQYAVDKEFEETLLYYSSSEELKDIILGLASGFIKIEKYKAKAIEVAQNYTPQNLYERLVKTGVKSMSIEG